MDSSNAQPVRCGSCPNVSQSAAFAVRDRRSVATKHANLIFMDKYTCINGELFPDSMSFRTPVGDRPRCPSVRNVAPRCRMQAGWQPDTQFPRRSVRPVAGAFLRRGVEIRGKLFKQVRAGEATAETEPDIERARRVRGRVARGSGPANRPADAVPAGIVSRDGHGPEARSGFIPQKDGRLRGDRDVELLAIVQYRCCR